jgi:transposase
MSKARTREPVRNLSEMLFAVRGDAIGAEHPARVLWQALGKLDLSAFLDGARAVEGGSGRPTHSPHMMLTLWTYAISEGVGSAREIARLVRSDSAYAWICGGVDVSHQVLSRFRVGHREALDKLMTDILSALMHADVLSLRLVAQDGMRVRVGAASTRSRAWRC